MRSMRWGLWAWAGTAPVVLVAVLVMWAEPGACTATFGFGKDETQAANCFEFWLNRYQTMVSGILALSAAVVAYLAARAQIRHAENLEEKRRQAEEYAARARLPSALSEICNYAEACFRKFQKRLQNTNDISPLKLPYPPKRAVDHLQNCIRFADHQNATKIKLVLSSLQMFEARISGVEKWSKNVLYERIYDGLALHIFAVEVLVYARGEAESWAKNPEPIAMQNSLRSFGFRAREHPYLFVLAGMRDAQLYSLQEDERTTLEPMEGDENDQD